MIREEETDTSLMEDHRPTKFEPTETAHMSYRKLYRSRSPTVQMESVKATAF